MKYLIKFITFCLLLILPSFFIIVMERPALASFTLDDEIKIGKEFYEKLSRHNLLIKDERVNDYITRLGNSILARSGNVLFTFRFSVIRSSAINAFATPGGYVYVNRGLINLCENESELAGVLAHEIAHVNSRHIAQQIEKSQKINMASLAAVLAGVFLGGGGVGTEAALGLTMATSTALSLKYSRENEEEADRLGMAYLVSTGYDGKGMLSFLKTMKNYEFYSSSLPSYFMTHPGTDERIGYIDSLLQSRYRSRGSQDILGGLKRVQTILALEDKNQDNALKYFKDRLNKNPDDVDALYGLAATQAKLGHTAESYSNFSRALALSPDDVDVLRDLAINLFNEGKTSDALTLLRRAHSINENDDGVILYLGRAYEQAGNYPMALVYYRRYLEKNPSDVNILYNIAMAYGKTDNRGESHYYFALFFKNKNKIESALFHLREALKFVPADSDRARDIRKELGELDVDGRASRTPRNDRFPGKR